jgi:hypothetical protein
MSIRVSIGFGCTADLRNTTGGQPAEFSTLLVKESELGSSRGELTCRYL